MEKDLISRRLASISNDICRLNGTISDMENLAALRSFEEYAVLSAKAARAAEWVAIRLRNLVYATTLVRKQDDQLQAADTMGIKIEQRDGIHEITLPGLMPKRRSGNGSIFLFDPLMAALNEYAISHSIVRYSHYTVCFVMIYDRALPERRVRDYDNLEWKLALDAAASCLMVNDSGLVCDAYHTTEFGDTDCTKMFIMDSEAFPQWYAQRRKQRWLTEN